MQDILTADLARAWWQHDLDAFNHVCDLMTFHPKAAGAYIRVLAETAPDGALSYIGVAVLEDLSMDAEYEKRPDIAIDLLIEARLEPAVAFEILSGPYPHYLEKWEVRERFAHIFTPLQIDALYDWSAHRGHRLMLDGEGFRIEDQSAWFDNWGGDQCRIRIG